MITYYNVYQLLNGWLNYLINPLIKYYLYNVKVNFNGEMLKTFEKLVKFGLIYSKCKSLSAM